MLRTIANCCPPILRRYAHYSQKNYVSISNRKYSRRQWLQGIPQYQHLFPEEKASSKHVESVQSNFTLDICHQIVNSFEAPILYAFAYGSKVFPQVSSTEITDNKIQSGNSQDTNHSASVAIAPNNDAMLDFIFVVEDTMHFHATTMSQFPSHYSKFMLMMDSLFFHYVGFCKGGICSTINSLGAHMYFNAYCQVPGIGETFKYGVIDKLDFEADLQDWRDFYVAARLQKPVRFIRQRNPGSSLEAYQKELNLPVPPSLGKLMMSNLCGAMILAASKLALNQSKSKESTFSLFALYKTLIGLSYLGDPRNTFFAEDPNKVDKILQGLYANAANIIPVLFPLTTSARNTTKSKFSAFDASPMGIWYRDAINSIPLDFKIHSQKTFLKDIEAAKDKILLVDNDQMKKSLKYIPINFGANVAAFFSSRFVLLFSPSDLVKKALKRMAWRKALIQSIKGLFTVGFVRSLSYLFRKFQKRFIN